MKTHRTELRHRPLRSRDKNEHPAGCPVHIKWPGPTRGQKRTAEERGGTGTLAAIVRGAVELTVGILLILVLWAVLTKPARPSPSPSWPTALSLAEEGAQKAILELQSVGDDTAKSAVDAASCRVGKRLEAVSTAEAAGAGEAHAVGRDRTFLYSNLRMLGEAMGGCYVTVSEEGPAALSISSTGIVYDDYRTLAQRTIQLTARRRPLFESAVFGRRGLFIATGAEVESKPPTRERAEDALSPNCGLRIADCGITATPKSEIYNPKWAMPSLLPPWGLPSMKPVVLSGGDVLTLSDSGVFPMVSLLDSSRLIIDRDAVLHIAGPLILMGESRIVIGTHVRDVSIYIDKDVMVEEGAAIVNLAQSALTLSIIGMEQYSRITLATREPLYGTIYAPNSEIRVGPEAYLRGGVFGDTVHVLAGTRMDYDDGLASVPSPLRPFAVVSCIER